MSKIDTNMSLSMSNASLRAELPQAWSFSAADVRTGLTDLVSGWSAWQYIVTLGLGIIAYDQSKHFESTPRYVFGRLTP